MAPTILIVEDLTALGLSYDLVSRKHARISARGDVLQVEDLGSRNGSKLNGQPLSGSSALKTGDLLSVCLILLWRIVRRVRP